MKIKSATGLRALTGSTTRAVMLALFLSATGFQAAAEPAGREIERAVNCQLSDEELPNLLPRLKLKEADSFRRPAASLALPTADIYELAQPITVHGVEAHRAVFMPARFLAVLSEEQGTTLAAALSLETDAITGAMRRELGNHRAWVALRLHHDALKGKMLVGCEYQVPAALQQGQDDSGGLLTD